MKRSFSASVWQEGEVRRKLEAGVSSKSAKQAVTSSSQTTSAGTRTATVPKHREVAAGTLRRILRQAGLSAEEFGSL